MGFCSERTKRRVPTERAYRFIQSKNGFIVLEAKHQDKMLVFEGWKPENEGKVFIVKALNQLPRSNWTFKNVWHANRCSHDIQNVSMKAAYSFQNPGDR